MKKVLVSAGMIVGAVLGLATPGQAQWGIAPYVGYHLDAEQAHLGSAVQFSLPARIGKTNLIASPGFDIYPFMPSAAGSSSSLYMLNLDMLYPIETRSSIAPYVGAGLAMSHASVSVNNPLVPGTTISASDTELGLNLKGGTAFNKGKAIRPFAEAVLLVGSGSTLLLRGGVYFTVGKSRTTTR